MAAVYFHDLPVYRIDEETYYQTRERVVSDFVKLGRAGLPLSPQRENELRGIYGDIDYQRLGPWKFNEIVGYVRLHFLGSQVRGEYYSSARRRLVLTRRKTFVYRTHKLAPEMTVPRDADSRQILAVILEYVAACRKEEPRRYFDDDWLLRIGPWVDWRAVMYSNNSEPQRNAQ